VALTFAGFYYRIQYIINTEVIAPIRADALDYARYAINLEEYGVFSLSPPSPDVEADAYRSPGYPFFLVLVSKFSNSKDEVYQNILLSQQTLGALLIPLTYLTARFILPVWGSLLAAIMVCISPHLVSMAGYVLTESLFAFLLLLSLYLFMVARSTRSLSVYVLSGLSFGYSYLVTQTIFFVPWILVVLSMCEKMHCPFRWRQFRALGVFCLVFSLFWAGYLIRNYVNVAPENRQGRALGNIAIGAYPDFIYKTKEWQYFMYYEDPEYRAIEHSPRRFVKVFSERFKQHPAKYLKWYFYGKPQAFWNWSIFQGMGDVFVYPVRSSLFEISSVARATHELMQYTHRFILLLVLAGAILHLYYFIRRFFNQDTLYLRDSIFLFSCPVYFTLLFVIFAPWPRYSIPLRPELFICASWTVFFVSNYFRKKRLGKYCN
jgi:4-amino-4-deoxy-L-arabinose transferase-like glycosyltransferase